MTKIQQLQQLLIKSLKAHDSQKTNTIRFLLSNLSYFAIELHKPVQQLTDADVETVFEKEVKKRKDSIQQFKKGNRPDLVAKEQYELDFISTYLPQKMTEEETKQAVEQLIDSLQIKDKTKIGQLIGQLKATYGNKMDMAEAAKVANEKLTA